MRITNDKKRKKNVNLFLTFLVFFLGFFCFFVVPNYFRIILESRNFEPAKLNPNYSFVTMMIGADGGIFISDLFEICLIRTLYLSVKYYILFIYLCMLKVT